VRALARLILAGLIAVVALIGYTAFRIWDQGNRDERPTADAIVVMGAAQYDGRPSPIFAARLDHAIELFHDGVAPVLIVTGGKAEGDRTTEAASAQIYATQRDVPDDAILVEDQSRTTLQSIHLVAALMADHGLETAVFVSDPAQVSAFDAVFFSVFGDRAEAEHDDPEHEGKPLHLWNHTLCGQAKPIFVTNASRSPLLTSPANTPWVSPAT